MGYGCMEFAYDKLTGVLLQGITLKLRPCSFVCLTREKKGAAPDGVLPTTFIYTQFCRYHVSLIRSRKTVNLDPFVNSTAK